MAGRSASHLKCLICAAEISNFSKSEENILSNNLLGKHLKTVFILRNILNLSSDILVKFLASCPNVEEWISICDNCDKLINQCKELYHKFEKRKHTIFNILKHSSSTSCHDNGFDNHNEGILDIFNLVRNDASEREQQFEAFTLGDLRANELADILINQPKPDDDEIVIKDESDGNIIPVDPLFELYSPKLTDNDDDSVDSIEEDKPEVKEILELEQQSSNQHEDVFKSKKVKRKYIRDRPPFRCPFCKIFSVPLFRSAAQVMKHLQSCKLENAKLSTETLTCSNCNQFKCPSDNIVSFYHHLLLCSGGGFQRVPINYRVFQCNLCPWSEKTSNIFIYSKFLAHIIQHKEFIYKCTKCNEPLKNSLESDKHWRKHHPIEYQSIPEDQRSSPSCHVSIKPAIPSVPCCWCPECGHEFPTEDLRDLHVSKNHPSMSKDNPCQLCDKRYSCPKELLLHQTIYHLPQNINNSSSSISNFKFRKCPLCPEVFTGQTGKVDLLTHQGRVHKISQFKCKLCDKEFLSYSALKHHRTSHQFDLKCGDCGKIYFSKVTFDRHVAVKHDKSRAFTCDICGKNLADVGCLRRHQRDVHGLSEKRFKCEVEGCGKRLKDLHSLKAHMDKHSNCPEFKCELCGKEFYTRGNLNRHHNTVHSEALDLDFVCDECPFRTKFKYNLGVHKKSKHNPDKVHKVIKRKRRKMNVK